MSDQPITYRTATGATVTLGFKINGFGQPTHTYACDGCGGTRGYKPASHGEPNAHADAGARQHAARCTGQDAAAPRST